MDLAARRRRRQGAALLVAAAAVVAIGVGVGAMVDRPGDGDAADSSTSEGEAFDRAEPAPSDGGGEAPSAQSPPDSGEGLMRMRPVTVSSDTFVADAERYRGLTQDDAAPAVPEPPEDESGFACAATDVGEGTALPVLYDGTEALLVYRPEMGDTQVVDLLQCGTADVLRTTTLPVP